MPTDAEKVEQLFKELCIPFFVDGTEIVIEPDGDIITMHLCFDDEGKYVRTYGLDY